MLTLVREPKEIIARSPRRQLSLGLLGVNVERHGFFLLFQGRSMESMVPSLRGAIPELRVLGFGVEGLTSP